MQTVNKPLRQIVYLHVNLHGDSKNMCCSSAQKSASSSYAKGICVITNSISPTHHSYHRGELMPISINCKSVICIELYIPAWCQRMIEWKITCYENSRLFLSIRNTYYIHQETWSWAESIVSRPRSWFLDYCSCKLHHTEVFTCIVGQISETIEVQHEAWWTITSVISKMSQLVYSYSS